MTNQNLLRHVAHCGLYCGLCAQRSCIPQQASQLQKSLHEEGFDDFYQYVPEMKDAFPSFWNFLQKLAEFNCTCRTGGGPPDCKIRQCTKQRNVEVCPQCKEYPCALVQSLAEHYQTLIQDGRRLQKVGLEKWVKEQEERVKRGVSYADMRYP
ncbi:DUF3795 domain-containing protein [Candidatus Bathyarchaeota archaeon]|nr:DUF3795 domain-containing protein [Candidatus Bathyarchaeota archaeon]